MPVIERRSRPFKIILWVRIWFKAAYFNSILLKEVWHECCKFLVWIVLFCKIKLLNLCIENVRFRLHVYSLKKYTNVWSKSYCLEVCLYIWNIYPFNVLNDFLLSIELYSICILMSLEHLLIIISTLLVSSVGAVAVERIWWQSSHNRAVVELRIKKPNLFYFFLRFIYLTTAGV